MGVHAARRVHTLHARLLHRRADLRAPGGLLDEHHIPRVSLRAVSALGDAGAGLHARRVRRVTASMR